MMQTCVSEGMETVAGSLLEDTLFSFDSQGGSFVAEKYVAAGGGANPLDTPHRPSRLSLHVTANFNSVSGFSASTPSDASATSPAHSTAGTSPAHSTATDSPPSGLTRAIYEYPSDMVLLPPARRPSQQAQMHMRRGPPNRSFFVQPL